MALKPYLAVLWMNHGCVKGCPAMGPRHAIRQILAKLSRNDGEMSYEQYLEFWLLRSNTVAQIAWDCWWWLQTWGGMETFLWKNTAWNIFSSNLKGITTFLQLADKMLGCRVHLPCPPLGSCLLFLHLNRRYLQHLSPPTAEAPSPPALSHLKHQSLWVSLKNMLWFKYPSTELVPVWWAWSIPTLEANSGL